MGAHIRSQARNVFCIACKYDRDDLAQTLVEEYEVDPNEPDAPSLTPLMMGVLNNSFDAIEYLIDLGVNIHIRDTAGLTPLHYAVVFNLHQSFFSLLLAAGADYKESPSGLNILHCAAPWANEATMACLPHHGLASVDPEATVDGETAESLFLQRTYRSPQLDAAFYFLLESVEKATAEMRQALSKGMDVGGTSDDEDDVFHDASEQL
ncbi:hypothetical protein VD0002_g2736 [Verticillium dahliae]|nr:hypothetical protein BJF96_g2833 [Verticillium dahliae]PNH49139.1 hypothetical protein VD0003_g7997 [Verticillium dahliae]PNH66704.1 hypothetical protein VD0002_g2736 [Verticillium dahliae]